MNTSPRSPNRGRAFAATLVFAVFAWTLALSVSPRLHERVHPDANQIDHTCAVTLVASGKCDHHAPLPLIDAAIAIVLISKIPAITSCWVPSPFLGARVLEHAPPAHS